MSDYKAKKHLVFGAGLIGGHLAGALSAQGFDVTLVARKKVQEDLAYGLTVSNYEDVEVTVPKPAFIDADEFRSFDIIWLTVKCTGIAKAIDSVANFVSPETIIICCQNGLGSDEIVRSLFAENPVVTAIAGYNVAELSSGHLHQSTQGQLVLEAHPAISGLARQIDGELLGAVERTDMLAEQWAKLQLNLANAVNALADLPVKHMLEDRGYRKIIAALQREMLAVTKAKQIELPKLTAVPAVWIPTVMSLPNWIFHRVAQKMLAVDPSARSSMWWDLKRRRKTEVEFLNGAVASAAYDLKLECPVNAKLVELVHKVENGSKRIGMDADVLARHLNFS